MSKIRISTISYLNTLPFLYGLNNSEYINDNCIIESDIPSACAEKLLKKQTDIGIVPVAIIPQLTQSKIISDYCIGATQSVKTVILLSNVPLNQIKNIYLDYQSRTSIELVKILAKYKWNINPTWIPASSGYEDNIKEETAGIIIGDRAFAAAKKYLYVYDLASEWIDFTGKPFVFACWVTTDNLQPEFIENFNTALKYGIDNILLFSQKYAILYAKHQVDLEKYFTENISYQLNKNKIEGMNLFFKYQKMIVNQ